VSDLAQHYLVKAGITAIRRVRKSDNNRIARACGATIVARTDEIQEKDIGTGCGLFEVKKLGDEYFTFLTECDNPKVGNSVAVHVHSRARSHLSGRIARGSSRSCIPCAELRVPAPDLKLVAVRDFCTWDRMRAKSYGFISNFQSSFVVLYFSFLFFSCFEIDPSSSFSSPISPICVRRPAPSCCGDRRWTC
jgi:hypothetical protein